MFPMSPVKGDNRPVSHESSYWKLCARSQLNINKPIKSKIKHSENLTEPKSSLWVYYSVYYKQKDLQTEPFTAKLLLMNPVTEKIYQVNHLQLSS